MDREVRVSDVTMKRLKSPAGEALSFKEKLELAKLLDRLGAAVIEIEGIENPKMDALRIKSIAAAVKNSVVAVPVTLEKENVDAVWNALCGAKRPRLQVVAAVSPMQMEYIFHKKPAAMLEAIRETVAYCAEKTPNVEFIADDACRLDTDQATLLAVFGRIPANPEPGTEVEIPLERDKFVKFIREYPADDLTLVVTADTDTDQRGGWRFTASEDSTHMAPTLVLDARRK